MNPLIEDTHDTHDGWQTVNRSKQSNETYSQVFQRPKSLRKKSEPSVWVPFNGENLPSKLKYSRDYLLSLYDPNLEPPENSNISDMMIAATSKDPMALIPESDLEKKIFFSKMLNHDPKRNTIKPRTSVNKNRLSKNESELSEMKTHHESGRPQHESGRPQQDLWDNPSGLGSFGTDGTFANPNDLNSLTQKSPLNHHNSPSDPYSFINKVSPISNIPYTTSHKSPTISNAMIPEFNSLAMKSPPTSNIIASPLPHHNSPINRLDLPKLPLPNPVLSPNSLFGNMTTSFSQATISASPKLNIPVPIDPFTSQLNRNVNMPPMTMEHSYRPPEWLYRDLTGAIQGPFTFFEMQEWMDRDFFPDSLPIKHINDPSFITVHHFKLTFGTSAPFVREAQELESRYLSHIKSNLIYNMPLYDTSINNREPPISRPADQYAFPYQSANPPYQNQAPFPPYKNQSVNPSFMNEHGMSPNSIIPPYPNQTAFSDHISNHSDNASMEGNHNTIDGHISSIFPLTKTPEQNYSRAHSPDSTPIPSEWSRGRTPQSGTTKSGWGKSESAKEITRPVFPEIQTAPILPVKSNWGQQIESTKQISRQHTAPDIQPVVPYPVKSAWAKPEIPAAYSQKVSLKEIQDADEMDQKHRQIELQKLHEEALRNEPLFETHPEVNKPRSNVPPSNPWTKHDKNAQKVGLLDIMNEESKSSHSLLPLEPLSGAPRPVSSGWANITKANLPASNLAKPKYAPAPLNKAPPIQEPRFLNQSESIGSTQVNLSTTLILKPEKQDSPQESKIKDWASKTLLNLLNGGSVSLDEFINFLLSIPKNETQTIYQICDDTLAGIYAINPRKFADEFISLRSESKPLIESKKPVVSKFDDGNRFIVVGSKKKKGKK